MRSLTTDEAFGAGAGQLAVRVAQHSTLPQPHRRGESLLQRRGVEREGERWGRRRRAHRCALGEGGNDFLGEGEGGRQERAVQAFAQLENLRDLRGQGGTAKRSS